MSALLALLASRVTATLKQQASIYGLIACACLIFLFSVGYVVDAAHAMLIFRYGAITASLAIAGCLIVVAIICLISSRILANRPSTSDTAAAKLSRLASSYTPNRIRFTKVSLLIGTGIVVVTAALSLLPRIRVPWRRRSFRRDQA